MPIFKCPGAASATGSPSLEVKKCPKCGKGIEVFSNDENTKCSCCDFVAYNNIKDCIKWCSVAKDCVGEDKYNELSSMCRD